MIQAASLAFRFRRLTGWGGLFCRRPPLPACAGSQSRARQALPSLSQDLSA